MNITDQSHLSPLSLRAAKSGGFLIAESFYDPNGVSPVLFAGSLDECLEFLKGEMSRQPPCRSGAQQGLSTADSQLIQAQAGLQKSARNPGIY